MLCPVCNETPLTGRKTTAKTCSAKCRSALYRKRKQQQRDTSQKEAAEGAGDKSARAKTQARLPRSPADSENANLVELVTTSVFHILSDLEGRGLLGASPISAAWRVDMQEQVLAQAPQEAAGYRLVLPGHCSGERPRLLPKRSTSREAACYLLTPFEYPDDLRLRDGRWYRIVWVDAQGHRLQLKLDKSVPGLYYFVGPASTLYSDPASASETEPAGQSPLTTEPADTSQRAVQNQASDDTAVDDDLDELVRSISRQIVAEETERSRGITIATSGPESSKAQSSAEQPSPPPAAGMLDALRFGKLVMSSLTVESSRLMVEFLKQPDWMIQLLYEERLARARTDGGPVPPQPPTALSHDDRKMLHSVLTDKVSVNFVENCKYIYALMRKYGLSVLDSLPTPLPPLSEAELQRLQNAIATPRKLAYLHYVFTWQESCLRSLPQPIEPELSLSSKEKNQLRRMMRDQRAVMVFEELVRPARSFRQR